MKPLPGTLRREIALVSLLLGVAVGFSAAILPRLHNWGILDWDQHLFHHAVPRATILDYHQLPLWNPYNWSGVPLLASPESRVLAPGFLLTLLFGEVVGLKLELVIHLVVGMLGAFHLLRRYGVRVPGSLAGAFVFMLSSWYAIHMTVGHTWALNVAFLPWTFLLYLKALESPRLATACATFLVLMFFGGGIYLVVMTALLLLVHAAASVRSRAGLLRRARVLAEVALTAAALSAVKLLPGLELMAAHPRVTPVASGFTPIAFWHALFSRTQTLAAAFAQRPGEFVGWSHEGMYVGLLALVPFAVGVLRRGRRELPLLVALLCFVWISFGDRLPISLWRWLHALPVFDNLRMVQRFGIVAVLMFAIFVGFGIDAFELHLRRRLPRPEWATAAAAAAALVLLADLCSVDAPIFAEAFPIPPMPVERRPDFQQIAGLPVYDAFGWWVHGSNPQHSTLSGLYPAFLSNRGSTRGYEIVPVPSRATPAGQRGYRGEAYLVGTKGRVRIEDWSPNRLVLEVRTRGEGRLVVNQNHAPGWRAHRERTDATLDGEAGAWRGLLAVAVGPDDRRIVLSYWPRSFVVGSAVSAAAVVLLVARAVLRRRRRGEIGASP